MESALDTFQGRVARRLTGRQPCWERYGRWFYPYLAGAMKEAGIVRIRTSILRRQKSVAQFIVTRPILGLCEVAVRQLGARVPGRWWSDGDRLEGGQGKGDSKGIRQSGGGAGAGVDGLGIGAQNRHTGGLQAAPGRRRPWE